LAFSLDILLSRDGSVATTELYQSLISSSKRLTYNQVEDALSGHNLEQIDPSLLQKLQALNVLAKTLIAKRVKRGALEFDSTEPKVQIDETGRAIGVNLKCKTDATSLVEEAMILANETVAGYMLGLEAPMIYRIHAQPLQSDLDDMLPTLKELGLAQKTAPTNSLEIQSILEDSRKIGAYELVSSLLLRSMKRARYSNNFTTHFGLASIAYTHFTSPIRRYPDLMVHRLLKLQLSAIADSDIQRQLNWISEHCSDGEYTADKASQEVLKLKLCEYMSDRIGTRYLATVSGVNSYGFFVRELSTYTEGFVTSAGFGDNYLYEPERQRWQNPNTGKVYQLGQSLSVELASVDVSKSQIEFVALSS
jgi:ribonuclease R